MKFDQIRRFLSEDEPNEYLLKHLNKFIDAFNGGINKLTIDDNIDGQIISDIIIPSGSEIAIAHKLRIKPRYRIILRQLGNGLITDGVTEWTDTKIYLKNNGGVDVTVSICVMR